MKYSYFVGFKDKVRGTFTLPMKRNPPRNICFTNFTAKRKLKFWTTLMTNLASCWLLTPSQWRWQLSNTPRSCLVFNVSSYVISCKERTEKKNDGRAGNTPAHAHVQAYSRTQIRIRILLKNRRVLLFPMVLFLDNAYAHK